MATHGENQIIVNYSPFKIEVGKIKEFARAIKNTNPIYFDRHAAMKEGYPAIPIPPTFFTVIDYWNDYDFYQLFHLLQLTPNQVLHGEQSYQYYEDVYEGDIITSQLIVKDQYKKNGKTFFKIETIYKNQRNTVVAISQATLILIDGEANDGASDD